MLLNPAINMASESPVMSPELSRNTNPVPRPVVPKIIINGIRATRMNTPVQKNSAIDSDISDKEGLSNVIYSEDETCDWSGYNSSASTDSPLPLRFNLDSPLPSRYSMDGYADRQDDLFGLTRSDSPITPEPPTDSNDIPMLVKFNSSDFLKVSSSPKVRRDTPINVASTQPENKKIDARYMFANFLNRCVLYTNNLTYDDVCHKIYISNNIEDKMICFAMAKQAKHIVRTIDPKDFIMDHHMVIIYKLSKKIKGKCIEQIIAYVLISTNGTDIFVYDIFMHDEYKHQLESCNPDTYKRLNLYSRLLTELDNFIKSQRLKPIINPPIISPRIRDILLS